MQEDRIHIRLALGNEAFDTIEIQGRRHLRASRVLEGKTRDEALKLLPMIYHVCARAHSFAARLAFACAQESPPPNPLQQQLLVLTETCREHARRIFLDWPILFGQQPDAQMILTIQRYLQQVEQLVFAMNGSPLTQPSHELSFYIQSLHSLLKPLDDEVAGKANKHTIISDVIEAMHEMAITAMGKSDISGLTLHEIDMDYLATKLAQDHDDCFISAPNLHETLYETGPLARMRGQAFFKGLADCYGNGLLTRYCAMVHELGVIPQVMSTLLQEHETSAQLHKSIAPSAGSGLGGVEAARGVLWHKVEMEHNRIKRYQILAPTEWNFHPRGALFRGLLGLRFQAKNQVHKLVNMITTALDPCVSCEVELA